MIKFNVKIDNKSIGDIIEIVNHRIIILKILHEYEKC